MPRAPLPVAERPWQLRLFDKTLKKKQKVALLARLLGPLGPTERILLLTNGDNNGAMNYVFRDMGARWTWGECEASSIPEMQRLLGEPVVHCNPDHLDFPDDSFDAVVVIDVHEHLVETAPLNRELFRVVRPGGRAIVTTPNGDLGKLAVRIKDLVGMTKDAYGHVRVGYTIDEHRRMLSDAGFQAGPSGSYSQFPTEMLELGINFAYVKFLNRRRHGDSNSDHGAGPISPSSEDQVRKVEKTLRIYSAIYPLCRAVSSLDVLTASFITGYAVAVVGTKPVR
ncbi:MAG: class I SAM-dependent methyltransferase [Gemmatimonadales bacterium]